MSHHHLKRLQHNGHSDSHDRRSILPNDDEILKESIDTFTSLNDELTKLSRSFKPGPHRARRGGARSGGDRHWHPTVSLPTRVINYELAESFMDHSTNPLSSDLYKIRFKHSSKQWPNGRFVNYKEKGERIDGNSVDVVCSRTFPLVPKRKKLAEKTIVPTESNVPTSTVVIVDPTVQQEKKKQADKQTNFYANLFGGCAKLPRIPTTTAPTLKQATA